MTDKRIPVEEEKGFKILKYSMLGIGALSFLIGLIRQWPVIGKGYMPFIEGRGYMAFIMGLIIIILGFSLNLFVIEDVDGDLDKLSLDKDN